MRAILAFAITGCLATNPTDSADPDGPGGQTTVTPVASGTYHVTSAIDLTVEALLPQTAADAVELLRTFEASPGDAMFDLAEDVGVPAVGTIRDALPSYLEDKVTGWIDDQLAPAIPVAAQIVDIAETSLTTLSLASTFDIAGDTLTHTLSSVDIAGTTIALPTDAIAASATCSTTHGTLAIGDHTYGLAYGELIWERLDLAAQLATVVDCTAVAQAVASKCVYSVCVGHVSELEAICDAGVAELIDRVHEEIASMRFDVVHFASGTATVSDTALADGIWTAELNAGQGLRHAPATFTATR